MRTLVRYALQAVVAIVALSFGATTGALAGSGDVAGYSSDFARLLVFVGGSELTPTERARSDAYVAGMFRADPAAVRAGDAQTRTLLTKLATAKEWFASERREQIRAQFEMLPASDASRRIVDAHDPAIVVDRAHERVVSERSLVEWRRAYVWLASLVGVPGPGGGFVSDARQYVRTRYAALPDADQSAIAHVERNYPVGIDIVGRANAATLAKMKRAARGEAGDARAFALDAADLLSVTYRHMIDELVTRGALLGSAANYNMLYHRGYANGNYR